MMIDSSDVPIIMFVRVRGLVLIMVSFKVDYSVLVLNKLK